MYRILLDIICNTGGIGSFCIAQKKNSRVFSRIIPATTFPCFLMIQEVKCFFMSKNPNRAFNSKNIGSSDFNLLIVLLFPTTADKILNLFDILKIIVNKKPNLWQTSINWLSPVWCYCRQNPRMAEVTHQMPNIQESKFLIGVGPFTNSPHHPSWYTNCSES